jgi:hypothetical protein
MELTASSGEGIERIEIDLPGDFLDNSEASVSTQVIVANCRSVWHTDSNSEQLKTRYDSVSRGPHFLYRASNQQNDHCQEELADQSQ